MGVSRGMRLEIGPGHDIVTSAGLGLQSDGDAQTGRAHGAFCAQALHGLHKAPSRDRAEFDFTRLEHAVAADNAPAVVERINNCSECEHTSTLNA